MDIQLPADPCRIVSSGMTCDMGHYVTPGPPYRWVTDQRWTHFLYTKCIQEEYPTYFQQRRRGHLNDVLHAKPLGLARNGIPPHKHGDSCLIGLVRGLTQAGYTLLMSGDRVGYYLNVQLPQTSSAPFTYTVKVYAFEYARWDYSVGVQQDVNVKVYYNPVDWTVSRTIVSPSRSADTLLEKLMATFARVVNPAQWFKPTSAAGDDWFSNTGEPYAARSGMLDELYQLVSHRIDDVVKDLLSKTKSLSHAMLNPISGAIALPEPTYKFALGEDSWFNGLPTQPAQAYWMGYLLNESYASACENVPRLSENSISNILEVGSFLYTLFVKRRVEVPESLADAWLGYRYEYSTTKMDIRQAVAFVKRSGILSSKSFSVHGYSSTDSIGDAHITCHCMFSVANKAVSVMTQLLNAVYTYGLEPNAYVLWDSIPFSFIVDWFIPIGDILSRDRQISFVRQAFDVSDICFTFKYSIPVELEGVGEIDTSVYCRKYSATPPIYNGFYEFENIGASKRAIGYRILDTASLILG